MLPIDLVRDPSSRDCAAIRARRTFGLHAFALYNFLAGSYGFEQPVLGGRLQLAAAAPFPPTST